MGVEQAVERLAQRVVDVGEDQYTLLSEIRDGVERIADALEARNELHPAVQDDDAFLDRLKERATRSGRPELRDLLERWRREIDAAPFGAQLDVDTAQRAMEEGQRCHAAT